MTLTLDHVKRFLNMKKEKKPKIFVDGKKLNERRNSREVVNGKQENHNCRQPQTPGKNKEAHKNIKRN